MKVVVLGGSGYVGGELLRILVNHPDVTITAAGSVHYAGEYVHRVHPNLKGVL
ncbi:MAG: N-acetyl-gamma-glutamyl-phosphate reductase, partial [Nitrososphaerota archaeon]|nr:N-acetyl-gamma-glutamyl-phosphate reductase [Nitrososphaerota archaeon]